MSPMMHAEQAVVLVGYGQNLYPLVDGTPKPLLPVGNKPMIAHVLELIEEAGILDILVVVNSEATPKLSNYLTKVHEGNFYGRIEWVTVDEYGTADALRSVKNKIKTDFLVIGCDLITDIPLSSILECFRLYQPLALTLLAEQPKTEYTRVGINKYDPKLYVGMDKDNKRILYMAYEDELDEDVQIRSSLLNRFGTINVYNMFEDVHVYLFKKQVIELISLRKDLSSLREDFLPFLVRCSVSKSYARKEEVDGIMSSFSSTDSLRWDLDDPMEKVSTPEAIPNSMTTLSRIPSKNTGILPAPYFSLDKNHSSISYTPITSPVTLEERNARQRTQVLAWSLTLTPSGSNILQNAISNASKHDDTRTSYTSFHCGNSPSLCMRVNDMVSFVELNRYIAKQLTPAERVAASVECAPTSQIGPDSVVGDGTKFGEKCFVKKSMIGSHCGISKGAKIVNSIILDYVTIEDNVKLEGCIVSQGATIKEKSVLKDCEIGYQYVVEPSTVAKSEQLADNRVMSTDEEDR